MLALRLYRLLGQGLEPFIASKLCPSRRGELPRAKLWLHAASVGEAGVAAAIIKALREKNPSLTILLTLQTETGLKKARELLGGENIALAPLDCPGFVARAFENVRPQVLALIETELWPNLISSARKYGVKILLLNGRLSQKSLKRYLLLKNFWAGLLNHFEAIGVIGPKEAERFLKLGAPQEKIRILGNAKYDLLRERCQKIKPREIKALLDTGRLITFGSVRSGEEKQVVEATRLLLKTFPTLTVALVPRHLSLVKRLKKWLASYGLPYALWSQKKRARVIIVDEIGPLLSFYAASYAAFVGGSLIPKGGQNPLEPAAFKRPVIFGPYLTNFPYEAKALKEKLGEEIVVRNAQEIFAQFSSFLRDGEKTQTLGERAYTVFESFVGASKRYASLLNEVLIPPP